MQPTKIPEQFISEGSRLKQMDEEREPANPGSEMEEKMCVVSCK